MTTTTPTVSTTVPDLAEPQVPSALYRLAGGLGLAQVVMMFSAITLEVMDDHTTSAASLTHDYATANLTRVFGGGYVEALSFVVLVPALVIVARIFGRGSESVRAAAQTFLVLGTVFVACTLAVGFAPGAAAMYGAHHGADATSVAMVNDIRNFGYYLQVTIQGGMAIALGAAAVLGRRWPRLIGWTGVVVGAAIVVGTPFAENALGMLWLLWWLVLVVVLIKGRPEKV